MVHIIVVIFFQYILWILFSRNHGLVHHYGIMSQYLTDMVPCNYKHSASSLLHTDVMNENFTIGDMH